MNNYILFVISLIATVFFVFLVDFIYKVFLRKITKNNLNKFLLNLFHLPFIFFVSVSGFYFALNFVIHKEIYLLWLNRIYFVLLVFIFALFFARLFTYILSLTFGLHRKYTKPPKILNIIIEIVVYFIAIAIILEYFNVQITPILATLGVGGLALGLALKETLANFFAGLSVLSERQIDVGDYIEVEDNIGFVEDIGWRSTKIKTPYGYSVIIPNSIIAESKVINYSSKDHKFSVSCGVSYDSDLEKVEKIVIDVAKKIIAKTEGADKEFKPYVYFYDFADSNIMFRTFLKVVDYNAKFLLTHNFIKALKKRFDKEKIDISWPIVKVYDAGKFKK